MYKKCSEYTRIGSATTSSLTPCGSEVASYNNWKITFEYNIFQLFRLQYLENVLFKQDFPNIQNMIIAREKEQARLTGLVNSNKAELVACYGRWRIGKTFLIRTMFIQKPGIIYFNLTGLLKGSDKDHLLIFGHEFEAVFNKTLDAESLNGWMTAFEELHKQVLLNPNFKVVLFFDELPWLSKKHSKFLSTLDHYWNTKWQYLPYVKIVICGSSGSWMVKHVINSKGACTTGLARVSILCLCR